MSAPEAPVCWSIGTRAPVLDAIGHRSIGGSSVDFCLRRHLAAKYVVVGPTGHEHVVLGDAHDAVTVRMRGARCSQGQVRLIFQINGIPNGDRVAAQFAALNTLLDSPRFDAHRTRRRLFMRDALIALDAHSLHASYRETAVLIYGPRRVYADWSSPSTAMKERMRNLRARGEALRDGAYRRLLE